MGVTFTARELSQRATAANAIPRWLSQGPANGEVFTGKFACMDLPRDLSVHYTDGFELASLTHAITLPGRLSFAIILHGRVDFSLQGKDYQLEAPAQQARCAAFFHRQPLTLHRHLRAGARVRKVHVSVTHQWLHKHYPQLCEHWQQHGLEHGGQLPQWPASPRMIEAAETIVATEEHQQARPLKLESRALLILDEGLDQLRQWYDSSSGTPRQQRLETLLHHLDQQLEKIPAPSPNLSALAQQFGMSTSTLQRHFRARTGTNVQDYCRTRRLLRARELLLNGQACIGEAAYQAGYRHSANFIAAYRQMFGCSPGQDSKTGRQPSCPGG